MSAVRRRGGECRQLTYDGIVDGYNFGFKIIDERIAHVVIIVMVRLRVACRIVVLTSDIPHMLTIKVQVIRIYEIHENTDDTLYGPSAQHAGYRYSDTR